jgi:hypothetical protein
MMSLKIRKRGGDEVSFNPQKIYSRVKRAAKGLNVNADEVFIKVITSVPTEGVITTKELDKLVYEIAAAYTGSHHDYSRLASSVAISAYHKATDESFCNTMKRLHEDGVINDILIDTINEYLIRIHVQPFGRSFYSLIYFLGVERHIVTLSFCYS